MDENLKRLVRALGEAINSSVNESKSVNDALASIRETGNDVFLVLEATIAFKHLPTSTAEAADAPGEEAPEAGISLDERLNEISPEDKRFLKNLRISTPEKET